MARPGATVGAWPRAARACPSPSGMNGPPQDVFFILVIFCLFSSGSEAFIPPGNCWSGGRGRGGIGSCQVADPLGSHHGSLFYQAPRGWAEVGIFFPPGLLAPFPPLRRGGGVVPQQLDCSQQQVPPFRWTVLVCAHVAGVCARLRLCLRVRACVFVYRGPVLNPPFEKLFQGIQFLSQESSEADGALGARSRLFLMYCQTSIVRKGRRFCGFCGPIPPIAVNITGSKGRSRNPLSGPSPSFWWVRVRVRAQGRKEGLRWPGSGMDQLLLALADTVDAAPGMALFGPLSSSRTATPPSIQTRTHTTHPSIPPFPHPHPPTLPANHALTPTHTPLLARARAHLHTQHLHTQAWPHLRVPALFFSPFGRTFFSSGHW